MGEKAESIQIIEEKNEDFDLEMPPEGMAWRKKINGVLYPCPLKLGIRHFSKAGVRLKYPVRETVEDYELVPKDLAEEE